MFIFHCVSKQVIWRDLSSFGPLRLFELSFVQDRQTRIGFIHQARVEE